MTAAGHAHDVRDDPFAGVMGAGRGGGRSHLVLPAIEDQASFNVALAELHEDRKLASSSYGHDSQAALVNYMAGAYTGNRSRALFGRFGIGDDAYATLVSASAGRHIRAIARGADPRPADPYGTVTHQVTATLASRLADLAQAHADDSPSTIKRLFPTDDQLTDHIRSTFAALAPDERDRPILDRAQWQNAIHEGLTGDAPALTSIRRSILRQLLAMTAVRS